MSTRHTTGTAQHIPHASYTTDCLYEAGCIVSVCARQHWFIVSSCVVSCQGIPFEGNYSGWLETKAKRLEQEGKEKKAGGIRR